VKVELAVAEGLLESIDELSAKNFPQDLLVRLAGLSEVKKPFLRWEAGLRGMRYAPNDRRSQGAMEGDRLCNRLALKRERPTGTEQRCSTKSADGRKATGPARLKKKRLRERKG
jgi:hypothetical protein